MFALTLIFLLFNINGNSFLNLSNIEHLNNNDTSKTKPR